MLRFISIILAFAVFSIGSTLTVAAQQVVFVNQASGTTCKGGWRGFKQDGSQYVNSGSFVKNLTVEFSGSELIYQQGNAGETSGRFIGDIQTDPDAADLQDAMDFFSRYQFAKQEWRDRMSAALNSPRVIVVKTNQAAPRSDIWLVGSDFVFGASFHSGKRPANWLMLYGGGCFPMIS